MQFDLNDDVAGCAIVSLKGNGPELEHSSLSAWPLDIGGRVSDRPKFWLEIKAWR